jgi:cytochrome c5
LVVYNGATSLCNSLGVSGAVTTSGALTARGASTLSNGLVVYNGATSLCNSLGVSGAVTTSGALTALGASTLSNGLVVYNGATSLCNSLGVSGALTTSGALTARGASTLSNGLAVYGGVTTLCNNLGVAGTLDVAGAASFKTVNILNPSQGTGTSWTNDNVYQLGQSTSMYNCAQVGFHYNASGDGTGNIGFLAIYGRLVANWNGAGNFGIGMSATSSAPLYMLDVYGTARVNATNTVVNKVLTLYDGASGDAASTATNFSGFGINSSVLRYQVPTAQSHKWYSGATNTLSLDGSGNMTVFGASTLSNGLTVYGGATSLCNNLGVSGTVTTSGALTALGASTLSNGLVVYNGATSLCNSLGVSGTVTTSGALTARGASTLSNGLTVYGGATSLCNNLGVSGNLSASNIDFVGSLTQNGVPFVSGGGGGASASASFVPTTNNLYDVGSNTYRWRSLYASGLDVSGTATVNSANSANNKLVVLYDPAPADAVSTATNFYGFGYNASYARYQAATAATTGHKWYSGATNTMTLDGSGNLTAVANVTANSDARLKSDLVAIPDALAKIKAIRGYTYRRADIEEASGGSNTKRYAGVVAQEVREVLPEVVQEDEASGLLSVAYGNMAALFVEGIKELERTVAEHTRAIESLRRG